MLLLSKAWVPKRYGCQKLWLHSEEMSWLYSEIAARETDRPKVRPRPRRHTRTSRSFHPRPKQSWLLGIVAEWISVSANVPHGDNLPREEIEAQLCTHCAYAEDWGQCSRWTSFNRRHVVLNRISETNRSCNWNWNWSTSSCLHHNSQSLVALFETNDISSWRITECSICVYTLEIRKDKIHHQNHIILNRYNSF